MVVIHAKQKERKNRSLYDRQEYLHKKGDQHPKGGLKGDPILTDRSLWNLIWPVNELGWTSVRTSPNTVFLILSMPGVSSWRLGPAR